MARKILVSILAASLMIPAPFAALGHAEQTATTANPVASSTARPARSKPPAQASQSTPSRSRRHASESGTSYRRHSGISKKEWLFLGAVAGTSMGIGALAAGAKGLAIGAIVGGWGAYAGHRFWKWIR